MSIINTRIQNARASYPNGFDRQELRQQNFGWINLAKNSNLLTPSAMSFVMNHWGAPALQIPVMSKNKPTPTGAFNTCTFGNLEANSDLYNVTFIEDSVAIDMIMRESDQNEISFQQEFERKFSDAEEALADLIEAQIHTVIDAAKATTYNSGFVGAGLRYPLAGGALQVSATEQDFFFNDMKSIMFADDFTERNFQVLGDAQLESFVQRFGNQGGANNTNQEFQFNGYTFGYSRSTTTTGGAVSTGFVMPTDTIAYFSIVSPDAKRGQMSKTVDWDVVHSDLLGIDLEIMRTDGCTDASDRTGNTSDTGAYIEQWQIGMKVAVLTPYNLGTNGGIKKFDFLP